MTTLNTEKMPYRYLGNSGLRVSAIGFGNAINFKPENYETDKKIVKTAIENGVNFFDTAEWYENGVCETVLGKIFKELDVEREHLVISTKMWIGENPDINSTRNNSRKHIKEGLRASIKRLQLDYVDIVFAHAFDNSTPLEEIVRSFHEVIEEGLSFYWGTSNWRPEHVFEALAICEKYNLHKPIAAQNQYNMIVRDEMEHQYRSLYEKFGYGTTFWSPLGGGYLTGKYLDGIPEQKGHRLTEEGRAGLAKMFFFDPYRKNPNLTSNLKKIKEFSQKELGFPMQNLALAWVINFKYTSTAIIGARSVEQLENSLASLELVKKLTPEVEGKINRLLDNNPPKKTNFVTWKPYESLRPVEEEPKKE